MIANEGFSISCFFPKRQAPPFTHLSKIKELGFSVYYKADKGWFTQVLLPNKT